VRFRIAGESGLVVELGAGISVRTNTRVRALGLALEQAGIPGLAEVVPTYRSLAIYYDPLVLNVEDLQARVRELAGRLEEVPLPPSRVVELPTVYGGAYGPDLPFVARHTGLTEAEVTRLHSRPLYHVYALGFTGGFAYLGGLPARLATPRRDSPRLRVPKGSVGIGGKQTGAHPMETPGGWRIIGRTCAPLFDISREPPTPVEPGDKIRFVPISEAEYLARGGAPGEPFA
jgi:inhibitor of KinA